MLSDAALARLTAHCAALTAAAADATAHFTAPAVGFDLQGDTVRDCCMTPTHSLTLNPVQLSALIERAEVGVLTVF